MKPNSVSVVILFCSLLLTNAYAGAEMRVLDIQSMASNGNGDGEEDSCADYLLEQIDLSTVYDPSATSGTISVVNAEKHPIIARKLTARELGQLMVKVKAREDKALTRGVIIQLLQLNEDEKTTSLETIETDLTGQAEFTRTLSPGSYQVAVSCKGPMLAGPLLFGAGGGGALAIGLLSNDGGSSSSVPRSSQVIAQNEPGPSDTLQQPGGDKPRGDIRAPRPPKQPAASPSIP